MDCILLFNNPDKTLAMIYICNNYLIEQNVIKHIQTQFFLFFFLKGVLFRVQHTSVVWLYLCQTLSIKQLLSSNNKYIFVMRVGNLSDTSLSRDSIIQNERDFSSQQDHSSFCG